MAQTSFPAVNSMGCVKVLTNAYSVPLVAPVRGGMTNADVLALKAAGLSDQIIIDKIRASRNAFSVETADLVALKTAGVADGIISAMLAAK